MFSSSGALLGSSSAAFTGSRPEAVEGVGVRGLGSENHKSDLTACGITG